MDYRLEELGPGNFQKLAQALIGDEYQDVQCMPLRQPDGGRDAVSFQPVFHDPKLVFQVKYTKKIGEINNPSEWVIDKIEKEKDKIEELIDRGMEKYIFITNVEGTSYKDKGDIDEVHSYINDSFNIDGMCWWRGDIERRLDNNRDVKWSYPQVMRGQDVIGMLVGKDDDKGVMYSSTTKSFIRGQYDDDKNVKFRQTELDGSLLGLFIDVPLNDPSQTKSREYEQPAFARTYNEVGSSVYDHEWRRFARRSRERPPLGAATLLLSEEAQSELDRVILEGAPGQGKSTVVQYICQVHRIHILEKEEYDSLPPEHTDNPIRVPFKIELRDFGSWLSGENPFAESSNGNLDNRPPTLEAFMSAVITYHSGGVDVKVKDLHKIIEDSPVLLVLDGLDEVGDVDERKEVVNKIESSIGRIDEIASSIQVVVTTRPSSFSGSPDFTSSEFNYLSLDDVNEKLVREYADKWMEWRSLSEKERNDISRVLDEKMSEPHVNDLAKNPMQLTILLDLVNKKGVSLPDKRTSLYRKYIELFFDRESTKSEIVKNNRRDLIKINGFVAWHLHCRSEVGKGGSIKEENLKDIIEDITPSEKGSLGLADRLFRGVVLRIGALVQRVEGKYEFEVQPLREYFAAHYLYDTVPYSPTGEEQNGTLPDRFEALSKSFYWSNVTRFFAGFLNTGQLPALYHVIENMSRNSQYGLVRYPQELSARLLSDYVFSQYQEVVDKILGLMFEDGKFRRLLAGTRVHRRGGDSLSLPEEGGRRQLLHRCIELIYSEEKPDIKYDVSFHLEAEYTKQEREEALLQYRSADDIIEIIKEDDGVNKLSYIGILEDVDVKYLEDGLSDRNVAKSEAVKLASAERYDVIDSTEDIYHKYRENVLEGWPSILPSDVSHGSALLGILHHPRLYRTVFTSGGDPDKQGDVANLGEVFGNTHPAAVDLTSVDLSIVSYPSLDNIQSLHEVVTSCLETLQTYDLKDWRSTIAPWDRIVEKSRSAYGTHWSHLRIATLSSTIRSRTETCTYASDVLDPNIPLCSRARYARLRAGDKKWWQKTIESATSDEDIMFLLLILLSTASINTLNNVFSNVSNIIDQLSEESFEQLSLSINSMSTLFNNKDYSKLEVNKTQNPRIHVLVMESASKHTKRAEIYRDYLIDYKGNEKGILRSCQEPATFLIINGNDDERLLDVIRRSYQVGVYPFSTLPLSHRRTGDMSIESAKVISESVSEYPTRLVEVADGVLREHLDNEADPVGEAAERGNWFSSQI